MYNCKDTLPWWKKFIGFKLLCLIAGTVGLFTGKLTGYEWVTLAGIVCGLRVWRDIKQNGNGNGEYNNH